MVVRSVTVSMRVMSAGTGYRYLLDSVAVGDGHREPGTALADYYTAAGTPPGYWLGTGVAEFGDGTIPEGMDVTEEHLERLLGSGVDPITGEPLGRAYPTYRSRQDRVTARADQLDSALGEVEREAAVVRIEAEEADRTPRRAVAGYDVTFSAPKSVSVLWALADPDTREAVLAAHRAAVAHTVALFEADVAATRTGVATPDGAVAQVPVNGVAATAFEHWDSRAGDPQLHTHVVIANKVRTHLDGKWRSLDGRPIHAAVVALSEYYNTVLADRLTATLGVDWEARQRGRDRNPILEITGVDERLIAAFSTRTAAIEAETEQLIADYLTSHGRRPTPATVIRLRQQATLATRPDKQIGSLADLTAGWRHRAADLGVGPRWTDDVLDRATGGRSGLSPAEVEVLGRRVVEVVGERRSTWRHWNLHAEASRQTAHLRFTTTDARTDAIAAVVAAAEAGSVRLTPPDLAATPAAFRRADGTSVFRPVHSVVFTSTDLLDAEDRLLRLADTRTGPAVPDVLIDHALAAHDNGQLRLGADQADAVRGVAVSGRVADVLVGPAGTGKTTTMAALRGVWESVHGLGSVVGLAPSAAAAAVLADELDIVTTNTAKWLHDHHTGLVTLQPGQLVVIDEASLAGSRTLDAIASHAADVGAKVVLVGDPGQLGAVDAGGAFGLLATSRPGPPSLTDPRRFTQPWEATTTLALRHGNTTAVDTYTAHDRVRGGTIQEMIDGAYAAWTADVAAGRDSLLIAADRDTVTTLNGRARTDRIAGGGVDPTGPVELHDGTAASAGDVVVTRRNDRTIATRHGWVRNGDRWTVTATHPDGTLTVRNHRGGGRVTLPAGYVAAHVELGYATTVHRAQGATVDTAHTVAGPAMTREALYVAMTRGRHRNTVWVATDAPDTEPHHDNDTSSAVDVLASIISRSGVERAAHQLMRDEQDRVGAIAQLAAEYETIAAVAQHDRWTHLLHTSGLTPDQVDQIVASEVFGPLGAALRRAEAYGQRPEDLLPHLVAARPLDDADDPAAVIHHRVERAAARPRGGSRPRPVRLIAGLIPAATGPMAENLRHALDQRARLIEHRADAVVAATIERQPVWLRRLGPPPADPRTRRRWTAAVRAFAAYRDRYGLADHEPLKTRPTSTAQRRDLEQALAQLRPPTPNGQRPSNDPKPRPAARDTPGLTI